MQKARHYIDLSGRDNQVLHMNLQCRIAQTNILGIIGIDKEGVCNNKA